MKYPISILLGLTFSIFSWSQTTEIHISKYLIKSRAKMYKWIVNGQSFTPEDPIVNLRINYPNFDTIIHYRDPLDEPYTIFTRFKPDLPILLDIGCCDDGFNMYSLAMFKKNMCYLESLEKNETVNSSIYDSIYYSNLSIGPLELRLKNLRSTDSLYCFTDINIMYEGEIGTPSNSKIYSY